MTGGSTMRMPPTLKLLFIGAVAVTGLGCETYRDPGLVRMDVTNRLNTRYAEPFIVTHVQPHGIMGQGLGYFSYSAQPVAHPELVFTGSLNDNTGVFEDSYSCAQVRSWLMPQLDAVTQSVPDSVVSGTRLSCWGDQPHPATPASMTADHRSRLHWEVDMLTFNDGEWPEASDQAVLGIVNEQQIGKVRFWANMFPRGLRPALEPRERAKPGQGQHLARDLYVGSHHISVKKGVEHSVFPGSTGIAAQVEAALGAELDPAWGGRWLVDVRGSHGSKTLDQLTPEERGDLGRPMVLLAVTTGEDARAEIEGAVQRALAPFNDKGLPTAALRLDFYSPEVAGVVSLWDHSDAFVLRHLYHRLPGTGAVTSNLRQTDWQGGAGPLNASD